MKLPTTAKKYKRNRVKAILILIFLFSSTLLFSQTMGEYIDTNYFFRPYFRSPKTEFIDSIEQMLVSNDMIDSSTITIQTPFNLDALRRYNSNIYSSGFCFYIDSIHLDTFAVTMVERDLYQGNQKIGRESFNLKSPLSLGLDCFYHSFGEGTCFVKTPDLTLIPFYRTKEVDRHSNYRFLAITIDENQHVWVNVKFSCNCYIYDDKRIGSCENKEIEGWTILNQLQIGYYCPPY